MHSGKKFHLIVLILMLVLSSIFSINNTAYAEESTSVSYAHPSGDPPLARGSKGEDVCWLQESLNQACGADLVVDDAFGAKTEEAVLNFQKQHGLPETGQADTQTIETLVKTLTPDETQESEQVKEQQDEKTDPAIKIKVDNDRKHIFKNYWKTYFRTIKLFVEHPKNTASLMAANVTMVTVSLIGVFLEAVFVLLIIRHLSSYEFVRTKHGLFFGSMDIYRKVEPIHISGCVGFLFKLTLLGIALSPLFADGYFLAEYFGLGIWSCIWRVIVYTLMRLAASAVLFLAVAAIAVVVLSIILTVPVYPVAAIVQAIRKINNSSSQIPSPVKLYKIISVSQPIIVTGIVISAIVILYLNVIPLILISVVN
ncbi:MAG TPA: peptidoglycan-binding domain-containing protein [Ruminococcus flavefaciens]|nr:peptidoglycan-binding domain-containing protein [Ruminococcus flavefaciens]